MNKKGFTLVELLAVIVILAVVMLIGGTTVLPMMQKAQKSSLGTEGVSLKKAAENAFQSELIKGANARFKSTDTVCFSMKYLCNNGYYDKGCTELNNGGDKYAGSVLVDPTGTSTVYKIWITNNTYSFMGEKDASNNYKGLGEEDITNPDKAISEVDDSRIHYCGKTRGTNAAGKGYVPGVNVYCSNDWGCNSAS